VHLLCIFSVRDFDYLSGGFYYRRFLHVARFEFALEANANWNGVDCRSYQSVIALDDARIAMISSLEQCFKDLHRGCPDYGSLI